MFNWLEKENGTESADGSVEESELRSVRRCLCCCSRRKTLPMSYDLDFVRNFTGLSSSDVGH